MDTTQSNLQTQCNAYENPNDFFFPAEMAMLILYRTAEDSEESK